MIGQVLELFVAIGFSTIAFITMFWAVHASGAAPTAMVMNLEPVFTIAMSFWILNEAVSLQRLIGATIVIGSVVLSQWVAVSRDRQNRAQRRPSGRLTQGLPKLRTRQRQAGV